jgi:hypothetical protein
MKMKIQWNIVAIYKGDFRNSMGCCSMTEGLRNMSLLDMITSRQSLVHFRIWEGSVWLKLITNAPPLTVQSIPVVGPLLACVCFWDLQGSFELNPTMGEAI